MVQTILKKLEITSDRKIALFLFACAFLLRSLYAILIYFTQPLPATNAYYEIAEIILEQKSFFYFTGNSYYESAGPLLPWLNALTMLVFGKNYLGLYLVTALGAALITYFTYKLARLVVDKQVSIIAGTWSTLYLFYFYYTPAPGKDIWMAFFMVFLLYSFAKLFFVNHFTYWRFVLFALAFTLSFHLDERFFVFAPFIFLAVFYFETNGFKRLSILKSLLFGAIMLVLMAPWTIRNYNKHGKIVIISTRTEAFTDKVFGYESRGHMIDDFNNIYGAYYIKPHQFDSVARGLKTHTDWGRKISQAQVEAMKRGEMPAPLTGINAMGIRTLSMLEPFQLAGRYERSGYFYYQKSVRQNIATFITYGFLFLFSFWGFYLLYRNNKRYFYLFASVIIVYVLIHALTIPYTNWRYRLPLDSIFIIVGWYGIVNAYMRIFKRKLLAA